MLLNVIFLGHSGPFTLVKKLVVEKRLQPDLSSWSKPSFSAQLAVKDLRVEFHQIIAMVLCYS